MRGPRWYRSPLVNLMPLWDSVKKRTSCGEIRRGKTREVVLREVHTRAARTHTSSLPTCPHFRTSSSFCLREVHSHSGCRQAQCLPMLAATVAASDRCVFFSLMALLVSRHGRRQRALMSALGQQPVSIAIDADQSSFRLLRTGVFTATCRLVMHRE